MSRPAISRLAPRIASLIAVLALSASVAPLPGHAATVTIEPTFVGVNAGDAFDLTVSISGLGDGAPASLGLYDVVVNFDDTLTQFQSASFGSDLGSGSVQYASVTSPGVLRLFEMSQVPAGSLDATQPATFTLATLTFSAVGTGDAIFTPDVRGLYDPTGAMLAGAGSGSTTTSVVDGGGGGGDTEIPEPSAALLFPVGLALCALRRRTR